MTRIGLLSDSHGHAAITARAAAALVEAGAQMLVHLGDVGSQAVLDALLIPTSGGGTVPVRVVFGNTDDDLEGLSRYARMIGIEVDHPGGRLMVDGKTLAFTHGHIERLMRDALAAKVDYLCHGHTHRVRDERVGVTRVINPGALHRAARYSAAVLDAARDRVEFHWLDDR